MPATVLDIGNCTHDHKMICRVLSPFKVRVLRAQAVDDALALLTTEKITLVLVNRQLDIDSSSGVDLILKLRANPAGQAVKFMLVSNFDWAQAEAVKAGALPGFGKDDLATGKAGEVLGQVLSVSAKVRSEAL